MATKTLKKKVPANRPASKLGGQVADSARDIWLAGLGAFSRAQQESGKLVDQGNKLFDKLVAEGTRIEKRTRQDVEGKVTDIRSSIRGDVESRVDSVRRQANDNLGKLENLFEERVARVLGRLGVPTADDVNKLSARVQRLSDQVALLAEKQGARPAAKTATRKPAASKTAGATSTRKPAASKTAKAKASKSTKTSVKTAA